ncbi:hypothetical protein GCM10008018_67480 [Paenibacillus marchantiophytorum]|uniref:Uncharacterized protein n=1 Tax=Paenibacillus marchantiophytorum TaxID=1619310 RepID=A0ABQ1FIS7_9BACL|nr:hypothetical protein [Paenibacillus marchantiophytorum]GGA13014.1 hypothetical protein GCM10008018_67480 [Paenibacillus marchantiophytorum]
MSKWKKVAAIVALNVLLSTTVYADSVSNWDNPSSTVMQAERVENQLLMTKSTIKWDDQKLKMFQSDDIFQQFIPALAYKVEDSDELRSKLMFTNVPGAKFTRKLATYTEGEEIKLSVTDTSRLRSETPYVFYTTWLHTVEKDSRISFRSLQRYLQPNGTLNDLYKTDDELATITFDTAEKLDKKFRDFNLPESFESPFKQYAWQEEVDNAKVKSYVLIDSAEKLETYKQESAKRLKDAQKGGNRVRFAVTFKNKGIYPRIVG